MAPRPENTEAKTERLVAIARDIIRTTGDFDLSMRQLAARGQVSLRTAYQLFGAKNGVIRAILKSDQAAFRQRASQLNSENLLDNLFDRVRIGIEFFAEEQPFYRALFRASQGYSGGDETEAAQENLRPFTILCRRVQRAGMIEAEIDAELLAQTLTDIWASSLRTWANSSVDIALVNLKVGFGFAVALAGAAPEPYAAKMRERRRAFEKAIGAFENAPAKKDAA